MLFVYESQNPLYNRVQTLHQIYMSGDKDKLLLQPELKHNTRTIVNITI